MTAAEVRVDAQRRRIVYLQINKDAAFPARFFAASGNWVWGEGGYTNLDAPENGQEGDLPNHLIGLTDCALDGFREDKRLREARSAEVIRSTTRRAKEPAGLQPNEDVSGRSL